MDILLEKIYKIVIEFERLRFIDSHDICDYEISNHYKEGSFTSYKDITDWNVYRTGNFWGGKAQYCWFKTRISIPQRFENKRVFFSISTGHKEGWDISNPQFLIYVNDVLRQGLDVNHKNTLLSAKASSGDNYDIVMLGYSGIEDASVILKTTLKVVEPTLEDFYYNISNLFWALTLMNEQENQRQEFIRNLIEAVDILDLRKIYSQQFYQSVEKANEFLKGLYYTTINTSAPTVTAIGHTHIDIAWMWTIEQTKEKAIRSFSTVLELMELYPNYKFMSSQPQLYAFVKEYNPELYEKIKEKIAQGRWEVDGGMWLEADCNIPSGESLVRQFLYGVRFIKEEFGKMCKTLWLPDVFGYSPALPQLIRKSGMSYMMTSKLDWNRFNKMPHDSFMWRGIDGSKVLTHLITTTNDVNYHQDIYMVKNENPQTTYNGRLNANQIKGTWTRYQNKLLSNDTLHLFGFGDGGGGPTETMLENYERLKFGLPGLPRVTMEHQSTFFDRLSLKTNTKYMPTWQGELYLEFHQGTYTSMAKNKRYNRKGEFLLQELEFVFCLALSCGFHYKKEALSQLWKLLLTYQFHDIIPGSSIKEVYDNTDIGYKKLFDEGAQLLKEAMHYIYVNTMQSTFEVDKISCKPNLSNDSAHIPVCMVYNMASYVNDDLIELPIERFDDVEALIDIHGHIYPVYQNANRNKAFAYIEQIKPKSSMVLFPVKETVDSSIRKIQDSCVCIFNKETEEYSMSNKYYIIRFNASMEIISLFDKEENREIINEGGRGNILQLFEDRPLEFDNWNIDYSYKDKIYEINEVESFELIESNPLFSTLEIIRKYGDSVIIQTISIYEHHKRIDFHTKLDWHEEHLLLKAAFEVDINSNEATYDIQYGDITRSTHNNTSWQEAQYEVCAHQWADFSEAGFGVSLMNDCKYGHEIKGQTMKLTLLKCGTYPNEVADQGEHEFTYSIYSHGKTWRESDTVKLAYNLNVPLWVFIPEDCEDIKESGEGLNRIMQNRNYLDYSFNKDNCPHFIRNSYIECDLDHVRIDTIKMAEDDDSIIVRVNEFKNMRGYAKFRTSQLVKEVFICDLIENKIEPIILNTEQGVSMFTIPVKGYDIITLSITFA